MFSSLNTISSHKTGISFIQQYVVLQGLVYIIYSALWFYYMSQLLHTNQNQDVPILCRDINPTLRTVLLVIAWIKVVSMAFYMCVLLSRLFTQPSIETFVLLIAYVIIFGVFVYQIQFLNAVEESVVLNTHCDEIEAKKRQTVISFNSVIFVFGIIMIVFGLTGQTVMQKMFLPTVSSSNKGISKRSKRKLSNPH